jgi:hypothetical protein
MDIREEPAKSAETAPETAKEAAERRTGNTRPEASKDIPSAHVSPLALDAGELPKSYHETLVVLLPVDPYLVHAYWEVAADKLDEVKEQLGAAYSLANPVLRFVEMGKTFSANALPSSSFDVEVRLESRNWYVHLWSPDKVYHADLGLRRKDGSLTTLATSNEVQTPRAWPAAEVEDRYLRVEGDGESVEAVEPAAGLYPSLPRPVSAPGTRAGEQGGTCEFETSRARLTAASGPADYESQLAVTGQIAEAKFPNPIDSPRFARTESDETRGLEQEGHASSRIGADYGTDDIRDSAPGPGFPLPERWLQRSVELRAALQGGANYLEDLGVSAPFLARGGPPPAEPYLDLCSTNERALALGISSSYIAAAKQQTSQPSDG